MPAKDMSEADGGDILDLEEGFFQIIKLTFLSYHWYLISLLKTLYNVCKPYQNRTHP